MTVNQTKFDHQTEMLSMARQSLSWLESELHTRGMEHDRRHELAKEVRDVLNDYSAKCQQNMQLIAALQNAEQALRWYQESDQVAMARQIDEFLSSLEGQQ